MVSYIPNPNEEIPKIWDYQLVSQMPNACGLASVLMAIDPNRSGRIKAFLEEMWNTIEPLIQKLDNNVSTQDERYQYVLEYLLLKIQGNGTKQFLYDYLTSRFSMLYEDQRTVNNYLLTAKREKFLNLNQTPIAKAYDNYILDSDLINTYMLKEELVTYKTDIELKILMELFGFRYILTEAGDGTGAFFFTKKNIDEGLEILCEAHANPDKRIILGLENHWVFITGLYPENSREWRMRNKKYAYGYSLKDFVLVYNDPLGPDERYTDLYNLDSNKRFYIFEARNENLKWLWDPLIEAIQLDIKIELEQMRQIEQDLREGTSSLQIAEDLIAQFSTENLNQKEQQIRAKYTHFKPKEIPKEEWISQIDNLGTNGDDGWGSVENDIIQQPIIQQPIIQQPKINMNALSITKIDATHKKVSQPELELPPVYDMPNPLNQNHPTPSSIYNPPQPQIREIIITPPTPVPNNAIKPIEIKNQTQLRPIEAPKNENISAFTPANKNIVKSQVFETRPIPNSTDASSTPLPKPTPKLIEPHAISTPPLAPSPTPISPSNSINIPKQMDVTQQLTSSTPSTIQPIITSTPPKPISSLVSDSKRNILPEKHISQVFRPVKQEPPSREGLPELSTIPKFGKAKEIEPKQVLKENSLPRLTEMPMLSRSKDQATISPPTKQEDPLPAITPLPPPPPKRR
jgi:RNAse (barnase) inhibitor barstar